MSDRPASDETRGKVLVEEELHPGGIDMSLCSRSAANVSTARMSSRSRSGKSARISVSVIPDAKYSRTSYTVIRSPRKHGFPPLFPGSRVMRFKRFMPSGYLWAGSEVKPRGLTSPLATCPSTLGPIFPLGERKPTTILGTRIDNEPGLGIQTSSRSCQQIGVCAGKPPCGERESTRRHPWPQRFFQAIAADMLGMRGHQGHSVLQTQVARTRCQPTRYRTSRSRSADWHHKLTVRVATGWMFSPNGIGPGLVRIIRSGTAIGTWQQCWLLQMCPGCILGHTHPMVRR